MSFGRIIAPYTQIQDFGGRNNTGGLMYVYLEPNTATRATLYRESTHEELTNPLTINDIGQVEDFVVDADYRYWIYVTDLDNNKVFDRHNLATIEEGGGQGSEGYYDGDWIRIDDSNRVNVNPTKLLSFETPLTVTDNEDEIIIGCDTSDININLEGRDGITTTKSGKKWIASGRSLQDKDAEQDADIDGLDTRVTDVETWQSNHGKVLTIDVNSGSHSDSYTYDGSNTLTVPITIPTIPEPVHPNNGTLTIRQGDDVKGTFTADQATDTEVTLDCANDATIRLLNEEGAFIASFTADQANDRDIYITRDILGVYSKSEVDAKITAITPPIPTPPIPISLAVAPGVTGSATAVTFTQDSHGVQQGSIIVNTRDFTGTLYTVPSYNSEDLDKVLTVKFNEDTRKYYLDWSESNSKPRMTTTFLGSSIYQSAPVMDSQSSSTVLSDLGNIPDPIHLDAGKTYLIQPSVLGTADYTLGASYGGSARFRLDLALAEADVTTGSHLLEGKAITIGSTQFNLKAANGSNQAGYRFITAIGSQSFLYTPERDQSFTKIILMNDGNVLGGDGSARCWMDFTLGSLIISDVTDGE